MESDMARYNTNNPVPSTAMQDLSDNAQIVDEFVNSIALTTLDRLGVERYTLTGLENLIRQVIGTLGWIPAGTFEAGATLTDATQTLKYESDGNYYRWDGDFPKVVAAGSTPASTGGVAQGAWVNVTDLTLRTALSQFDGFKYVGGLHEMRMTLAQAKAFSGFLENQRVFITDIGYLFKFNPERNLVPGQPVSAITVDDELHKLVTSGGMLEFDDYEKLRNAESRNYAEYQALMRTNKPVGMVNYGDSITWGQRPDFGQYPLNYPAQIAQTMTSLTQSAWSSQNMASPGDTAMVNYRRTMQDGTTGSISTIMLGVNDIKVAWLNGDESIDNINGNTLYGVKNYALVMRKFVARELLRGRCVVVLGTTQWVSEANSSPMSNMTECYVSRSYDAAAKEVAEEFGCVFVDTKRDIIQQFGISESCHDGIHLREDFLPIIGKRFAAFLMQQDYKNPCVLGVGDVFIPGFFQNPISSSRTIKQSSFTDGSSPPFGGAANNPEAMGCLLPNDATGGNVTLAFYVDTDSLVIYPSINSDGTPYSFNLILDNGATQPDYPSDVEIIPVLRDRQYILSGRAISGSGKKNRTTERYSQINTACYMHITTRGWHMITFAVGMNAGVAAVEGLVCDSWSNVRNNDVFGGVSGTLLRSGGTNTVTGFVTGCTSEVTGEFNVSIDNLVVDNYRVDVEHTEDSTFIHYQVIFKSANSFRIQFYNAAGTLVNPTSFRATVIGGR
ncbi:GDSL-type esterase/lipase family protein [Pectobacterium carotovorum]|uniref:tail fiber/spike domain-containing protein n=1 Tax=Pectobacterium carotovorum TaxID=554 RepID=UPI003017E0DA